jgi:hypothetical protein
MKDWVISGAIVAVLIVVLLFAKSGGGNYPTNMP